VFLTVTVIISYRLLLQDSSRASRTGAVAL